MEISIKKLSSSAILPIKAHPEDAGFDIFSNETVTIKPQKSKSIITGIAVNLPRNTVAFIWDRSGIASSISLATLGGVIDPGYQGEIKVILFNLGKKTATIKQGQKIAQFIVQSTIPVKWQLVKKFKKESTRGTKGFGSSGK